MENTTQGLVPYHSSMETHAPHSASPASGCKKKDLPQAPRLEHPNSIPSWSPELNAQRLLLTPAASLFPSCLTVFFRGSSSRSLPLRIIIMILF